MSGSHPVVTLSKNFILSNTASEDGGGVSFWCGTITLSDNAILGNTAGEYGGGIYVCTMEGSVSITASDNNILSNTANAFAGGVFVAGGTVNAQNDVVANNTSPSSVGVYLSGGSLTARHWTLVNNGNYALANNGGSAILTNTIVASHTVGGFSGANVTADHTLFFNSGTNCGGGASCTNNITGDPKFINPAAGDYHIGPGSAAIDAGIDVGVTDDIDGDIRPLYSGFDIGADEFPYPPVASFTSSSPDWTSQGTVFTNTTVVISSTASYLWNFGDASPLVGGTEGGLITHVYTRPGTFTVVLTASNPAGSSVASDTVTLYAASFTSNSPHQPGQTTLFTNTTVTSGTTTYLWSFGDGATSTLSSPTHSYASPGAYAVVLTATNFAGSGVATGQVLVDDTPPTGAIVVNEGDSFTALRPVTLTLAASDTESGMADMAFSDNGVDFTTYEPYASLKAWTLPAGDGVKTVHVRFRDVVGNVSPVYSDTIILDSTPPQGSVTINDGAGYTNDPSVTLALSATDLYSVPVMALSDDGVTYGEWVSYTPSYSWTLTPGDGSKTVYARFSDPAGNVVTVSDSIVLDTISPAGSLTIAEGATYVPTQTVTLHSNVSDTNGVAQMRFSNDGASYSGWLSFTPVYTWILAPGDGEKAVYSQYRDAAGNESAILSDTVILDTQVPVGSVSINAGAFYANSLSVTLNLSATDLSGVEAFQVSNVGLSYSEWASYTTSYSWTLQSGDGTKTVYVRFRDTVGHESSPVSDTILLDTTPPSGSVTVNGGADYTNSPSVTLTLDATDLNGVAGMALSNNGVTFGEWVSYTSSCSWTLTPGDGSKTVYARFRDPAGNVVTASDSIVLDTISPAGSLTIAEGATYVPTQTVTLHSNVGDANGVAQMRFSNDGASYSGWLSFASLYTWTLAAGDGGKAVYGRYRDAAGNESTALSDTVILDTRAPVGSIVVDGGAVYANGLSVTLNLSASDLSGVAAFQVSNDGASYSGWVSYTSAYAGTLAAGDGGKTVYVRFRDVVGHESNPVTDTITLDTVAPAGSIIVNGGAAYASAVSVTLTLSASDATSGLAQMQFSNDGLSWSSGEPFTTTKAWTLASGDGDKTVYARYSDNAGNIATYSDTVILDTMSPETSATPSGTTGNNGWWRSSVAITLAASDATSDVDHTEYCVDGGAWQIYSVPFTVSVDGVHTVEYWSVDIAGNRQVTTSLPVRIDTAPPSTTATFVGTLGNDGWYVSDVQVSLAASDSTSGIDVVRYRLAGGTWQTYSGTFIVNDGIHSVEYQSTDLAGNQDTLQSLIAHVDTTAPSAAVNSLASYQTALTFSVSWSGADTTSGLANFDVQYRDSASGTWTDWMAATTATSANFTGQDGHTYGFRVRARDQAGNTSAYSSGDTQTTIDATPPTPASLTINGGALSSTAISVTLAASATDSTSGVSWMSFSNEGSTWRDWEPYAASTTWSLTGYGTILIDGPKTVYGRFRDAAGNVSSAITSTIELNMTVGTNYGMSINDGALYTNQTVVMLTISAEPQTAQMQVSNDGGFTGAQWEPYSSHKAWTITQYGNYVIPRVVYVRYQDLSGNVSGNYQDDIVLDVTPPTGTVIIIGSSSQMLVASSSVTLRLNATDDVSGVGGMLISNEPDFAGATWEPYATSRAWTLGNNKAVYVRFRDNAGNVSQTIPSTNSWMVFLPVILR